VLLLPVPFLPVPLLPVPFLPKIAYVKSLHSLYLKHLLYLEFGRQIRIKWKDFELESKVSGICENDQLKVYDPSRLHTSE